jgi:hypothetical protein
MAANKDPQQIMREAEQIIAESKRSLEESEAFFRDQGLEPEKVYSALASRLDAKGKAEAKALFEKDMEDIERQVAEEAARASFANAPARGNGAIKNPRIMV